MYEEHLEFVDSFELEEIEERLFSQFNIDDDEMLRKIVERSSAEEFDYDSTLFRNSSLIRNETAEIDRLFD